MTSSEPAADAVPAAEPTALSPAAGLFQGIGRLRHARSLHPRGRSYDATFTGSDPFPLTGTMEAAVRISKATPTPGLLPDVLGVAVRLPGPVDLLFATTGGLPGLRHVLRPRRGFLDGVYTTLLPYEVAGELRVLALRPDRHARSRVPADLDALDQALPFTFSLLAATLRGPWRQCGELRVHRIRGQEVPWFDVHEHSIPELHPAGPFQGLRRRAYAGSRRGRAARGRPKTDERSST